MYHIHQLAKQAADNYQSYYIKNTKCVINVTIDKHNLATKEWSDSYYDCIKAQEIFEKSYKKYLEKKSSYRYTCSNRCDSLIKDFKICL